MKYLLFCSLFFTGCIQENTMLKERVRVLEIQRDLANRGWDLSDARVRELEAELHKHPCP
jgi:hypothetical protein